MPAIRLTSFRGMAPGLGAKLLESNQATEARNCRLDMGELIPWAAPSVTHNPAKWSAPPSVATIYKYAPDGAGPYWLHWPNAVSVARGPIADDPEQRLYYTTDDDTIPPRMTKSDLVDGTSDEWPVNHRPLGVPAPGTRPGVNVVKPTFDIVGLSTADDFFKVGGDQTDSVSTGGTIAVEGSTANDGTYNVTNVVYDSGADQTRIEVSENVEDSTADGTIEPECAPAMVTSTAYVYTYVTDIGEEGPPSETSDVVDRCVFSKVELSGMDTAPTSGRFTGAAIAKQRIYRAASGASGTEFLFVAEQDPPSSSYTDSVADSELVEPIPSVGYTPPSEGLQGLTVLSNGIAAGFVGSDLYLSEPYRPHAWPEAYRQAIGWPIVGLGAFGTSIVVLTEGHPYIVQGTTPASMTAQEIEQPQACVSARGIVSSGMGVLYPSPDGLVRVSGQGAQVITENVIDRSTWQAINPNNLLATWHEGLYVGFTANGSESAFTIDPRSGEFVWLDFESVAAYTDLTDDTLYLVDANGGADDGSIVAWNRGSANMTATWRSKPFIATPTNFGAGRLLAESYGTLPTQRLYGDDAEVYAASSLSRRPFRLPAGDVHRKWHLEVETDVTVSEAVIASTMGELDG